MMSEITIDGDDQDRPQPSKHARIVALEEQMQEILEQIQLIKEELRL